MRDSHGWVRNRYGVAALGIAVPGLAYLVGGPVLSALLICAVLLVAPVVAVIYGRGYLRTFAIGALLPGILSVRYTTPPMYFAVRFANQAAIALFFGAAVVVCGGCAMAVRWMVVPVVLIVIVVYSPARGVFRTMLVGASIGGMVNTFSIFFGGYPGMVGGGGVGTPDLVFRVLQLFLVFVVYGVAAVVLRWMIECLQGPDGIAEAESGADNQETGPD